MKDVSCGRCTRVVAAADLMTYTSYGVCSDCLSIMIARARGTGKCPRCGHELRAGHDDLGRIYWCPRCAVIIDMEVGP